MTVGYVLFGILGGVFAVAGSLLSGQPWIMVCAAYPLGGMVAVFVAALITFLVPPRAGGGRRPGSNPGPTQASWPAPDVKIGIV